MSPYSSSSYEYRHRSGITPSLWITHTVDENQCSYFITICLASVHSTLSKTLFAFQWMKSMGRSGALDKQGMHSLLMVLGSHYFYSAKHSSDK